MLATTTHAVLGTPFEPPFPEGYRARRVRHGLLLGRRADVLASARRVDDGRRLRGRLRRRTPRTRRSARGRTGHAEVVLAVFDPAKTSYEELLRIFWEGHDPTQGMRQGNDVGTQYRSADPRSLARAARRGRGLPRDVPARALRRTGYGAITTEIADATPFYYAEDYHQQYLAKNPSGYCGLGGTGVACPVGLVASN